VTVRLKADTTNVFSRMHVNQKVVVVTGGGSGIGRALCRRFAAEGARAVVVADIDEAAAAAVVQSVRARGGEALGIRTDVSELASVQALADTTLKTSLLQPKA
jgi:NAD(P)-dependent dehydrogenase (short-subunit alcohol dehydrogenase family)